MPRKYAPDFSVSIIHMDMCFVAFHRNTSKMRT